MRDFYRIFGCTALMLLSFNSFCQEEPSSLENFNKEVIQPYAKSNNFFKEQVYIHFNKSCYLPGDDIWFTAYVTDPMKGTLNSYTHNLYVELYNEKGKLIGHKILAVNNGTANSMMKIDNQESPGKYVFRAYTNWMKNFYTPEEFDQPLEIVGKSRETAKGDLTYDVQFFPESGTLLAGTFNKVAVKALDPNGKPAALKGIILDEKNDSVTSFNLDKMGMGQVIIEPEKNSVYKSKVTMPDGKEEVLNLPPVETKGVIATINAFHNKKIVVEVKSNPESIEKERILQILVHANGNVFQVFSARLTSEKPSITFSFDRKNAGNGVNYLTVFDEGFQPVCERLFYNNIKNIKGNIDIKALAVEDSVQFNLKIQSDSVKHHASSLSISVLPEETASNHFTNSLLANALLKSGIRGKIENPQYYIEKQDAEHLIALDLLMLTQGWRKYEWEKLAAQKDTSKISFDREFPNVFEKGFTIEGKVKSWLNGKETRSGNVSLFSPVNKLFSVGKVDPTGRYSFPNLYLSDSSLVIVSASSDKGKGWNRTITASLAPDYKPDTIIKTKPFISLSEITEEKIEAPLKFMPGVIQLSEVVIKGEKKKPFEKDIYVSPFDKTVEITKDKLHFNSLETFLLYEFNVRLARTADGSYTVNLGRSTSNTQPKLIIDEMEMQDWSVLSSFTLNEIEAISVNKNGNAMVGGGGGIIIKTRTTPLYLEDSTPTNLKNFLVKGYSAPIQYYTPKYLQTPETETYQKYASIYWKPDIITDSTGVASFKFNVPRQINNLNVRIEGISENGTIYLEEHTIAARKEN